MTQDLIPVIDRIIHKYRHQWDCKSKERLPP